MISMNSSVPPPSPPRSALAPEIGSTVRTPSGRVAVVLALNDADREAEVQFLKGADRARFRWSHLKPAGGPEL